MKGTKERKIENGKDMKRKAENLRSVDKNVDLKEQNSMINVW
jgi:hypothetical protein